MKNIFAYLLLPAGIATSFGGIHIALAGQILGWIALATGVAAVGIAYRMMRPKPATPTGET